MDGIVGFVDGDFNRGSARVQEAEVAGGDVACEEEEGFYIVVKINNGFKWLLLSYSMCIYGVAYVVIWYVPRRSIKNVYGVVVRNSSTLSTGEVMVV